MFPNGVGAEGRDVRAAVEAYCHDVTARSVGANGSTNGSNGTHDHSNGASHAWDGGADELDTQV